jgi:hypothetical protein
VSVRLEARLEILYTWWSRSLSLVFLGFGAGFEILLLELELGFVALEIDLRS